MVKSWKKFLESNSTVELENYRYEKLAKTLTKDEVDDNFYGINKYKIYISQIEIGFIDDNENIRKDIKINEKLNKYIKVELRTQSSSLGNEETISDIKAIFRKLKAIGKSKYKEEYENPIILDPNLKDLMSNIKKDSLDSKDPFSLVKMSEEGKTFIYNIEDEETRSRSLTVFLIQNNKTIITDLLFYDFYNLHNSSDFIDKEGNFWTEFEFKDIAINMYRDEKYVEKYYMPEDFDPIDMVDSEYIIEDIVSSISDENKKNYLTLLLDIKDFNEILELCEDEYEDPDDLIENISDEDLKNILNEGYDDLTHSVIYRYNDIYYDKFQKLVEDDIRSSVCDYIDRYIECDYFLTKDEKEYIEYIRIKFDPNIFIYGYDKDNDIEDWSEWGESIAGENINTIINEFIREHDDQLSINTYIETYLSNDEINGYIKEVLSEY